MGVNVYLLDRRTVRLSIGGFVETIGTLRRFWKITEIDESRSAEMTDAQARISDRAAPLAVMTAEAQDMALATASKQRVDAHVVLGWDADRSSVTDLLWDYLPILGYAVKPFGLENYSLFEVQSGLLQPMTRDRAVELQILDAAGALMRRGQPLISSCRSVRRYIEKYAEAHCVLGDGRPVEILTELEGAALPDLDWYNGKRPSDVQRYPEAV